MISAIVRKVKPMPPLKVGAPDLAGNPEWLVTNGLGGYASGTLSGACTRRYHGLLIAAFPAPLGRMVMFNHLAEELRREERQSARLGAIELSDATLEPVSPALHGFELRAGL